MEEEKNSEEELMCKGKTRENFQGSRLKWEFWSVKWCRTIKFSTNRNLQELWQFKLVLVLTQAGQLHDSGQISVGGLKRFSKNRAGKYKRRERSKCPAVVRKDRLISKQTHIQTMSCHLRHCYFDPSDILNPHLPQNLCFYYFCQKVSQWNSQLSCQLYSPLLSFINSDEPLCGGDGGIISLRNSWNFETAAGGRRWSSFRTARGSRKDYWPHRNFTNRIVVLS